MSGMFQRIARRQADRSDESVAPETPAEPATDAPAVERSTAVAPTGESTVEVPAVDAPTERIETVAPAPGAEQPTAYHPNVPPPAMDLTTRLPVAPTRTPSPPADPAPTAQTTADEPAPRRPGFRARGRMRRRLRYLRKLRELQARDLGGLVFDLRRFERRRDDLVAQKIDQIRACDDELRALELALDERRELRDVREPGIGGTCPRCFAVFGSAYRFCANCGAAFGGAAQGPAAQIPLAPPPAPPAPPEASGAGPQP
jgi:hypothetical protein